MGLCAVIRRTQQAGDTYQMTRNTGSMRYMAPEVYHGKAYNEKVDVYSFGIMAWQIASNQVPFNGLSLTTFAPRVFEGNLRPELRKSWPILFSSLLQRCWTHSPTDRPSFETIVNELQDLVDYHR
jgi:serine/threonine protein kinase